MNSHDEKSTGARSTGRHMRGRSRFRWLESVKAALNSRGMTVGAAQQCARDRTELRALVEMKVS